MGEEFNEFNFLEWFYCNCDFGPADNDVRRILIEDYERQTGQNVPVEYASWKEDE